MNRVDRIRTIGMLSLALCIASAILCTVGTVIWPIGADHHIMASVADALLRGGVPYRDALDIKGPVAFMPYALADAVAGPKPVAIRVVDLGIVLTLGLITFRRLSIDYSRMRAAAVLAAFWAMLYRMGPADTAQPDGWIAAAVLSLISITISKRVHHDGEVTGVILCSMVLSKPFYVIYAVLPLMACLKMAPLARRRFLSRVFIGGCLACLLILLPFAVRGGLRDYADINLHYALTEYRLGNVGTRLRMTAGLQQLFWERGWGRLLLCMLAIGFIARKFERMSDTSTVAVSLACGFCSVVLGGRYFPYHLSPLIAAIAVWSAAAVGGQRDVPRPRWEFAAGWCVIVLSLSAGIGARVMQEFQRPESRTTELGREIRRVASPTSRIAFYGYDPAAAWISTLTPASRIVFSMPLINGVPGGLYQQRFRREFVSGVVDEHTDFVLVDLEFERERPLEAARRMIPFFVESLSRYHFCLTVETTEVYVSEKASAACLQLRSSFMSVGFGRA